MAETPPEQDLEHDIDEFDERVTALDDDLDQAREKAEARSEESRELDDLAGDFEDLDPDEMIGDDAEGSFDDPDELDDEDDAE